MYRRARFEELDAGFFFFSQTPDEPYSDPWEGRFSSFATWTLLRDAGAQSLLYVFNVHFDARHSGNRRRAAELVLRRIRGRTHTDAPTIVLGDFNAPRFFYPVRLFRGAGFTASMPGGATYHFHRGLDLLPAIDHVLASPELEILNTTVDRRRYDGIWPSDHYLLAGEIRYR
jgi:endonuclease/exonuclease/phosphatase family metal-dependent hydrolase